MPDEPITDRQYLIGEIGHLRERTDEAARQAKEALTTASLASDKRYEALNELKAMAADNSARFATQERLESIEHTLEDKIGAQYALIDTRLKNLEQRQSTDRGERRGANWLLGLGLTVIGLGIALFGLILRYLFVSK